MFICNKYKFIWHDIPKTASCSIQIFLNRIEWEVERVGRHNFKYVEGDYFRWSVVRNPYDRLVSAWSRAMKHIHNKTPFADWLRLLESDFRIKRSQHSMIKMATNNNAVPIHIIHYENLLEELFELPFINFFGGKEDFPSENVSIRDRDWNKYLDKESEQLIWDRFKRDFETFGYKRRVIC